MSIAFKQQTLDNGLTIIGEVEPSAATAAAGFFVKTGARDEEPAVMGVSHFLEHMMFKGFDDVDADAINRGFDDLGARHNAYTSGELTCFYAQTTPDKLAPAIDLLGGMMRPALRNQDFDTEKGVILEEIAMYADNPFWVLYEEAVDRHYQPHGLSHRVLGTNETITALTRDQMQAYFDNRYSADNSILALAGNLDFDEVVEQASRLCSSWQTTNPKRDTARPKTSNTTFQLHDESTSRGYLLMVADAPAAGDDDRYAAALLAQILGGSDNSRLHWALVEEGIAEEAQSGWDGHAGAGDYFIYASCDPGKLEQVTGIIDEQINSLIGSIEEDDLVRLRARMATSATVGGERPGDRMQRLGRQWTTLGTYTTLDEELERISAVTLDDIAAVHAKHPMTPRTIGTLQP